MTVATPIVALDAWPVGYREPNDDDSRRSVVLVRLTAADGSQGWGEAVTLFDEASTATAVLARGLAEFVVGVDATSPAAAHAAVAGRSWWYGEGGLATLALAAIDMAAWDLAGRILGVSVLTMMGGAAQPSLPVFVSTHAVHADLDRQARELADDVERLGAAGVKVGFGKRGRADLGFDHDRDVAFVAALRSALGPGPRLCIDVGVRNRWSVPDAIRRVRAFAEHDLYWIEEPLGADDPDGYRRLQAAAPDTLIAYGEREWTGRGIARIADSGTVDVVGVDTGRAEGITGFLRAAALLQLRRLQINAHAFAGPLSYAAALAGSLASPAARQLEVVPQVNELTRTVAPDLPRPTAGRVTALPGPGLGVEVDEAAVRSLVLD